MSKIALTPDASGTGTFTIASPNSNTSRTLTLPDAAGELYNQGNAVGTVSQSGGTPTGAFIETGSTANGYYTRFADGTQMCWHEFSITPVANSNTAKIWTFPVEFSVAPVVQVNCNTTVAGTTVEAWNAQNPTTTEVNIYIRRTNTTSTLMTMLAVGRWF